MLDFYLKRKIIIGLILSIFLILISIKKCRKNESNSNSFFKFLSARIIPIFLLLGVLYLTIPPALDLFDADRYSYSAIGTLDGLSSNNFKSAWLGEYTISINKETYRVPKSLKHYSMLRKGTKYKISYFKHSRLVYQIKEKK